MKKLTAKMVALAMALVLMLTAVPAFAATAPTITWEGKSIAYTNAPITQSDSIYVALDETVKTIGATVERTADAAVISYGGQTLNLGVTSVGSTAYVSVRGLFEGLGFVVSWSRANGSGTVAITPKAVDEYSFNLGNFDGTVGAFCDVIMTDAKKLAFSDPFYPVDEAILTAYVSKKCENYGVKYYIEKDLLLTKLFADVDMEGAWVYILYKEDAVLEQYLALKKEETDMTAAGTYTEKAQVDLATRYGKLMGYSDKVIADMIAGA